MRMRRPCVNFELAGIFQPVSGEHAFHDMVKECFGLGLQERSPRCRAVTAWVSGVVVPRGLAGLLAGELDLLGVDDDNVVSGVDMRSISGLIFARQYA